MGDEWYTEETGDKGLGDAFRGTPETQSWLAQRGAPVSKLTGRGGYTGRQTVGNRGAAARSHGNTGGAAISHGASGRRGWAA